MKIRHSGGSLCEVSDEYGAALLASPDWEAVDAPAPKQRRPRRQSPAAVDTTESAGELASEE